MIINEGEDYFPKFYSRIDEPIFTYENNSVWEFYQLKEFLGENQLGTFGNHNFSWNPPSKHPKNLYERRGNFHGVTLFGLNAPEYYKGKIIEEPSMVPGAFEVHKCNSLYPSQFDLFSYRQTKDTLMLTGMYLKSSRRNLILL